MPRPNDTNNANEVSMSYLKLQNKKYLPYLVDDRASIRSRKYFYI
jgi:hypothetical protein